jgi:hypothetical protein
MKLFQCLLVFVTGNSMRTIVALNTVQRTEDNDRNFQPLLALMIDIM